MEILLLRKGLFLTVSSAYKPRQDVTVPGTVPVSWWFGGGGDTSAAAGADLESGWWQAGAGRSQANISWLTNPVRVSPAVGRGDSQAVVSLGGRSPSFALGFLNSGLAFSPRKGLLR